MGILTPDELAGLPEETTGAEERAIHEDGPYFREWFRDLMSQCESCLLRDVLRNQQDNLWEEWKRIKPIESPIIKDMFIKARKPFAE